MIFKLVRKMLGREPEKPAVTLAEIVVDIARSTDNRTDAVRAITAEVEDFLTKGDNPPAVKAYDSEHTVAILDPENFPEESQTRKRLGEGVDAIMGIREGEEAEVILTYCFDATVFDETQVKAWLDERQLKYEAVVSPEKTAASPDPDNPAPTPEEVEAAKLAAQQAQQEEFLETVRSAVADAVKPLKERLVKIEKHTGGSSAAEGDTDPEPEKQEAWI